MGATIVRSSMWAVLTCLAAAAAAARWASATPPSPTDLAHCPKLCGDVNISYPFGIGADCFRPGFEVTCNDSSQPPKLFLGNTTAEIVEQYLSGVDVSIVFNIATTPGVLGTYNRSWESPRKSLKIDPYYYNLVIVGCGIDVYMLNPDTDDVWGYCSSMCASDMAIMKKEADGRACSGMGCCTITFQRPVRAFRISIVQKEATQPIEVANATLKAFFAGGSAYRLDQYNFSIADLLSDKIDASTIGNTSPYLSTVITDQPNCRRAQSEPKGYACGINKCVDDDDENGGYHCTCFNNFYDGNRSLPSGGQPRWARRHTQTLEEGRRDTDKDKNGMVAIERRLLVVEVSSRDVGFHKFILLLVANRYPCQFFCSIAQNALTICKLLAI